MENEKQKFDINKFWDDFLKEDLDDDNASSDKVGNDEKQENAPSNSLETDIKEEKIDVLTADSDDDVFKGDLDDELDIFKAQEDSIKSGGLARPKPPTSQSISSSENKVENPTISSNTIDRIKNDDFLTERDKDFELSKNYVNNLSKLEQRQIDEINNKTSEEPEQNIEEKTTDVDDLAEFRNIEKQYKNGVKNSQNGGKTGKSFSNTLSNFFSKFKGKELLANKNKSMLWLLGGLTIVIGICIVIMTILLLT